MSGDAALERAVDWFRAQTGMANRFSSAIRRSLDEVFDGQRTGRYSLSQLTKVEKTYIGTKVEIVVQSEFGLMRGQRMDYLVAGEEVDAKWSMSSGGWMIPTEAVGELCLCMTADDVRSLFSVGIVRADEGRLRLGGNQDRKRMFSGEGLAEMHWLEENGQLAENLLLRLDEPTRSAILDHRLSGQGKVNQLFRHVHGRLVRREVVLTVAQQDDGPKRVRDARSGFAMLPAYLGYFLGDRDGRRSGRLGMVAMLVTFGFLVVFTAAGLLIGVGARQVVTALPWLALIVGLGLFAAGLVQVFGLRIVPYLRGPARARLGDSPAGMVLFGASYAIASLSCTLPIFLSLVAGAVASGSPAQAVLTFVSYGAGMALAVVALTVAVAGGNRSLINWVRPLASRLEAISGWVMVVAGTFIVWYWATVLSAGSVVLGANSVVRAVDRWSAALTGVVARRPLLVAAVLLGVVVVVGLVRVWVRRGRVALGQAEAGAQDAEPAAGPTR